MKTLKRTRYNTMNSWNLSTAPAYNLRIHNVIDNDLQDKVYEMMNIGGFYDEINNLIRDFDLEHDYRYQTGFNGRSDGYLVLYNGGIRDDRVYSLPGKRIKEGEAPGYVLRSFRKLAVDIVKHTEYLAKNCSIVDEEYITTRKIIT